MTVPRLRAPRPRRAGTPARRRRAALLPSIVVLVTAAWLGGCATFRFPPRRTRIESAHSVLPAKLVSNYLVIQTKWDRHGPYHFIIDTGSSATLVTPELVRRYGQRSRNQLPVRVLGANGKVKLLEPVMLRRLDLGSARFEGVQALEYNLDDLSNHLGIHIDGVLGFPLFRDTLLTLDYLHSRVVISPQGVPFALPGVTIPFNNQQNTPLIPIQLGNESFIALIDSGSDAGLSLNTVGLHPVFAYGPKPGALVATLAGDRMRMTGRLKEPLSIGNYVIDDPIIDVTNELSSVGGGILRHFSVTFDQKRNQITFFRPSFSPIRVGPLRSTGLSFTKTPAYWRVAAVVAGSPAERLGVRRGDLCARIDNEPVKAWPFVRYTGLIQTAKRVTYTFITGDSEQEVTLPVFDLVP